MKPTQMYTTEKHTIPMVQEKWNKSENKILRYEGSDSLL